MSVWLSACENALLLSGAYENQGLFKQALTDIEKVNRSEATSAETKEIEKRLKEIVSGKRPAGDANHVQSHLA